MKRLPPWFKQDIRQENTKAMSYLFSEFQVHTVCQEARCPNIAHCFNDNKATLLILGDTCTRNCRFCAVKKSQQREILRVDIQEPVRIAEVIKKLETTYVVITSVTRDDLIDGGAAFFSQTLRLIHSISNDIKIEVLIPDFQGNISSLKDILAAQPDVVAHNMETVSRLYPDLRPMADYKVSLNILREIKELSSGIVTKSSLMLGLGETELEVMQTLQDLRNVDCDILTLGQYLAPSSQHYPVREFILPAQFEKYREIGVDLGFGAVQSGPLVRSSFRAEELYKETLMTNSQCPISNKFPISNVKLGIK